MKVKISEIKKFLEQGKKVKIKSIQNKFVNVKEYVDKGVQDTYCVRLENGFEIKVSAIHRFFSNVGWVETRHLKPLETQLLCEDNKYYFVKDVSYVGKYKIVDVVLEDKDHCYFGNGILNHNSGKSYMAMQIAVNALNKGIDVVYFDSESAIDIDFIKRMGVNPDDFVYVQAINCEFVLETIESLLAEATKPMLLVWDSLAATPTDKDKNRNFDPNAVIGEKARILSKGFQKLTIPLANKNSALLIVNQLRDFVSNNVSDKYTTPYTTPGGKAPIFAYSLRLWLSSSKAKNSFVLDSDKRIIGTQVKVKIKKSRFGSFGRECEFKILWSGDKIAIQNEESYLDAISGSPELTISGSWKSIVLADGTVAKFQDGSFIKKLEEEPKFKERILEIMRHWLIERIIPSTIEEAEEDVE
jgi:RecA/RadA recombinase